MLVWAVLSSVPKIYMTLEILRGRPATLKVSATGLPRSWGLSQRNGSCQCVDCAWVWYDWHKKARSILNFGAKNTLIPLRTSPPCNRNVRTEALTAPAPPSPSLSSPRIASPRPAAGSESFPCPDVTPTASAVDPLPLYLCPSAVRWKLRSRSCQPHHNISTNQPLPPNKRRGYPTLDRPQTSYKNVSGTARPSGAWRGPEHELSERPCKHRHTHSNARQIANRLREQRPPSATSVQPVTDVR